MTRYAELLNGLDDDVCPIFEQEAHYVMNCTGGRPSDALATAIRYGLDGLTSPTAQSMRDRLRAADSIDLDDAIFLAERYGQPIPGVQDPNEEV